LEGQVIVFNFAAHPRTICFDPGTRIAVPAEAEVSFHFQPAQMFGAATTGGRVGLKQGAVRPTVDMNTGRSTIEQLAPMPILTSSIVAGGVRSEWRGNVLVVAADLGALEDLEALIQEHYFALPPLLAVTMGDAAWIERVHGTWAGAPFMWLLKEMYCDLFATSPEEMKHESTRALRLMPSIVHRRNRRMFAALRYFGIACRLLRESTTPGEFLAEVILNLAKTLDALFEQDGTLPMDAARIGLSKLGFDRASIDRDYIPAIALRNHCDVGHVGLHLLDDPADLEAILRFARGAEATFRKLLVKALNSFEAGEWRPRPYESGHARELHRIVSRMRAAHDMALAQAPK
jgi:hypothetical protein